MANRERAIRDFGGKSNEGLRTLLRECTTGHAVVALRHQVALTAKGEAKLHAVARTLPHGAEYEIDGVIVTCQRPYGHEGHCSEDADE